MTMNDLKDITKEKFLALDDDKVECFLQQLGALMKSLPLYLSERSGTKQELFAPQF